MSNTFFQSQLESWPLARTGHEALQTVLTRDLTTSGECFIRIQHNPARIRSTAAGVDAKSIAKRPCFLCQANRPQEQQAVILASGWEMLVNPYPILNEHYTIVSPIHQPQQLALCLPVMYEAAVLLGEDFMVFYNGPHCGASAPDHAHIQAGRWNGVPLVEWVKARSWEEGEREISPLGFVVKLYVGTRPEDVSDDVNVIVFQHEGTTFTLVIPRRKHRPECYFAEGERQRLVSPGALDMCGLIITPRKEDFEGLTDAEATDILCECGEPAEPTLHVGIMRAPTIRYEQHGDTFTLHDVTIGKQFHWQRNEEQQFYGRLRLVPDGDAQWAVNDIPLEQYLTSVISSEMNAHAPIEFLKAHAIVSRSWLLAQLERRRMKTNTLDVHEQRIVGQEDGLPITTLIRYYDNADHTLFDVCADDHCQRYQGLARITPAAVEAVEATRGQILTYEGRVVDARFSKCCGGISEEYATCWDDTSHPELASIADTDDEGHDWCDTSDAVLLATVLNGYDVATHDFYDWSVTRTRQEISQLVREKSGIDIGDIISLRPLERGISGRIHLLQIKGMAGTLNVGKELEIRRILSPTHLYSSRFDVISHESDEDGLPSTFTLRGRGWGHGVGMCQIGAAVMASSGFSANDILRHYYPAAQLEQRWK